MTRNELFAVVFAIACLLIVGGLMFADVQSCTNAAMVHC